MRRPLRVPVQHCVPLRIDVCDAPNKARAIAVELEPRRVVGPRGAHRVTPPDNQPNGLILIGHSVLRRVEVVLRIACDHEQEPAHRRNILNTRRRFVETVERPKDARHGDARIYELERQLPTVLCHYDVAQLIARLKRDPRNLLDAPFDDKLFRKENVSVVRRRVKGLEGALRW